MKKQNLKEPEQQEVIYIQEDLLGQYDLEYESEYIQRQIEKFGHLFNKTKEQLEDGEEFELGKNVKLSDVFKQRKEKEESLKPLNEMAAELKVLTDD